MKRSVRRRRAEAVAETTTVCTVGQRRLSVLIASCAGGGWRMRFCFSFSGA